MIVTNVLSDVERILVVTAHPDDIDFGAAATIAGWVDDGIEVRYCLVTRGDAGGFDNTPREQMPVLREEEQRAPDLDTPLIAAALARRSEEPPLPRLG